MRPLNLLERSAWFRTRTIAMSTVRGYLPFAVLMLIVKATEVSIGQ